MQKTFLISLASFFVIDYQQKINFLYIFKDEKEFFDQGLGNDETLL